MNHVEPMPANLPPMAPTLALAAACFGVAPEALLSASKRRATVEARGASAYEYLKAHPWIPMSTVASVLGYAQPTAKHAMDRHCARYGLPRLVRRDPLPGEGVLRYRNRRRFKMMWLPEIGR